MIYFNIISMSRLLIKCTQANCEIIIMIMIISCSEKQSLMISYSSNAAVIKANTPIILFVDF